MKRIVATGLLFTFLMNLTSFCSEKSWLQAKIGSFAQKMLSRHTYENDSFEHKRDRALLCLLPAPISQAVLLKQRGNMQHFLKQNEENACKQILQDANLSAETVVKIKKRIKDDIQFNLSAMKDSHNTFHDPSLPSQWISLIKDRCEKRNININSLNLHKVDKHVYFAYAQDNNPYFRIFWKSYNPANITLNMGRWYELQKIFNRNNWSSLEDDATTLKSLIDHELTHIIEGHILQRKMAIYYGAIRDSFFGLSSQEVEKYMNSAAYLNLVAAQEKTADTLPACSDPEISKDSVVVKAPTDYSDNLNDMKVIYANWQTSQAIDDFQQFKNSATQKISDFSQTLRTIVKA